jgi:hypothetical protein
VSFYPHGRRKKSFVVRSVLTLSDTTSSQSPTIVRGACSKFPTGDENSTSLTLHWLCASMDRAVAIESLVLRMGSVRVNPEIVEFVCDMLEEASPNELPLHLGIPHFLSLAHTTLSTQNIIKPLSTLDGLAFLRQRGFSKPNAA